MGSDNFAAEAYKKSAKQFRLPILDQIIKIVCEHRDLSKKRLLEPTRDQIYLSVRDMITYLSAKHSKDNLKEISERLKVNHSSLSRGRHRFIKKLIQERSLREEVKELKKRLKQ